MKGALFATCSLLALLLHSSKATSLSLPPHLRHLAERHYFVTWSDGETSFIQADAKDKLPPRRLARGDVVHNIKTLAAGLVVGDFIAAGNFGNVYKLTAAGSVLETGRVIKQSKSTDDTSKRTAACRLPLARSR